MWREVTPPGAGTPRDGLTPAPGGTYVIAINWKKSLVNHGSGVTRRALLFGGVGGALLAATPGAAGQRA
ncbi:hypothetical protein AB0F81_46140, partial [Actinoplanes sp. NPDC024001]|uniref:hypothetical protein n=1 Tax=Actinoplanes sp. NPDC024001 TaxID=3154598 RepID=UPI0033E7EEFF